MTTSSNEQTHRRRAMNYNMNSFSDTETIRHHPNSETVHHPTITQTETKDANWTAYNNARNVHQVDSSTTSRMIYDAIHNGTYETLVGPLTTEDLMEFYRTPSIFAELYDDPDILNSYTELTRLVKASEAARPIG